MAPTATRLRDPATVELLGGRPKRWPAVLAAAVVTAVGAAAVAGALALWSVAGDTERSEAATQADQRAAPAEPPAPAIDPAMAPRAEAVLTLPQPTGHEGDVPLGYPRSVAGAVAAAYGYSRLATGLDVDRTLRAVEALADPAAGWFPAERDRLADGLVAQRAGLGLAAVGPAGGASVTVTPSSYQVRDRAGPALAGDSLTVLTLNVVSAVAADATRTTGTVVLRWALRWDGDRWLATELYSDDRHDDLALTPLTSAARSAGWEVARGG